ncbi:MAG: SUMF1/EgtB/PvdO family nonheme iron enzyme, partial [Nitrospira sp.]|nr:SUMF1/EgtB/PvdO family nonheme iron enzyme [Nitrospira sp.]
NVWEWYVNEYNYPTHIYEQGDRERVLRGGSWSRYRPLAHAAYRLRNHPHVRHNGIGFRVVRSSPIA